MKKLKTTLEIAEAAFKNGDDSKKELLQELWPDIFITDPYLKACKILGETPEPELQDRSNLDKVSIDAYGRLIICIRAKNMIDGEVWKPVYDGSENHYWNYFTKTPLGFSCTRTYLWHTITTVGPRLEYRSYDLAMEGAKEFDKYYQDYFNH